MNFESNAAKVCTVQYCTVQYTTKGRGFKMGDRGACSEKKGSYDLENSAPLLSLSLYVTLCSLLPIKSAMNPPKHRLQDQIRVQGSTESIIIINVRNCIHHIPLTTQINQGIVQLS